MGRWSRIQTRMPDELHRAVVKQAARLGINQSEYVREALVAYTAWHQALDAVDDGNTTEDLRDPVVVARVLGQTDT